MNNPDRRGITPAYAGKSSNYNGCGELVRDHPRVCGEKEMPDLTYRRAEGSPPRMRGKAGTL